jgi:hypothetical protein
MLTFTDILYKTFLFYEVVSKCEQVNLLLSIPSLFMTCINHELVLLTFCVGNGKKEFCRDVSAGFGIWFEISFHLIWALSIVRSYHAGVLQLISPHVYLLFTNL